MKALYALLLVGLICSSLKAQNNYVATTPNSTTPGLNNTLVGDQAGSHLTSSSSLNSFFGGNAGINTTAGKSNTFLGAAAGYVNATGSNNTYVGAGAGLYGTRGANNTYVGYQAGAGNTSGNGGPGYSNVALGIYSAFNSGSGHNNVVVGDSAGHYNTVSYNVFVGSKAGYYTTTGDNNNYVGAYAGYANTTGSNNSFSGNYAGYNNTSGSTNSFFGYAAGYSNTIGAANTLLGWGAGTSNQRGSQNTLVGYSAGGLVTGNNNTFYGYKAGANVTTGNNNIIIGPNSGTAITTSDENVLMGYNSQAEEGLKNATAIGAHSRVAVSNAMILGNQVNVGIGTSAPTDRLEVVSPSPDKSGIRITRLTKGSPVSLATDQFLTVDEQGEIVKARYQLRINTVSEWSDKVFSPQYRLRSLSEVFSYVQQNGHLPGVPSAEQVVKEGVDLVKMNAVLLEKVEELTLYSLEQQKANQSLKSALQAQQADSQELKTKVARLEVMLKKLAARQSN